MDCNTTTKAVHYSCWFVLDISCEIFFVVFILVNKYFKITAQWTVVAIDSTLSLSIGVAARTSFEQ
jgi:hypothetical protein